MKKPDFDELLAEYRQVDLPALPSSFPSHVLREIRRRTVEAKAEPGWLFALSFCLRPAMIAAGLSVAVCVGTLVPGIIRENDSPKAAAGLGLNVFSTSAPNMPSGLLR